MGQIKKLMALLYYVHNCVHFLVQMRTRKFASEIYWPLQGPILVNASHPATMIQENGRVGALFASKAFVQLIVNPMVGKATNNWGYEIPFMIGTCILLVSALSKSLQKPEIIQT